MSKKFIFTDAFSSGERDTIPFLINSTWRGKNWNEKKNLYDIVLSVPEALEELLSLQSCGSSHYWRAIKAKITERDKNKTAREKELFMELAAANFYMLYLKNRTDLMARWAAWEFEDIFTTK